MNEITEFHRQSDLADESCHVCATCSPLFRSGDVDEICMVLQRFASTLQHNCVGNPETLELGLPTRMRAAAPR